MSGPAAHSPRQPTRLTATSFMPSPVLRPRPPSRSPFLQMRNDLLRRLLALRLTVVDDRRRNTAGAEAARGEQRDLVVSGCLFRGDLEALADAGKDRAGSVDVAGRARANHARVLTLRLQGEKRIKGSDPVDLA